MNLFKKLSIGIAIGLVVFASVSFGIGLFQKPESDALAASVEPTCTNRTVGNTATYNPFPLQFGVPNPTPNANQTCNDIPLLNHYNPVLGTALPERNINLQAGGYTAVEVYYNNGADPTNGAAITSPMASLDVTRNANVYTIRGNLKGGNANLSSNATNAGGDLTITVPAGMKLAYKGRTTRWFPQANIRKDLQRTTGNTPDDPINDNSVNGIDSNPIFSSFAGYNFPASTGVNLSYADTNQDAVRDTNSPNTLPPGFLNFGYILLNLEVVSDNLPPVLPNQTITIKQGGTGDFKSYTTDSTYKGTDPGNNVPLTFTTGTLTGLNGVNCTNNSTTGVVTCTADATAPLTPDRTFTVTPKNSINITGSPATYTVKVVAQDLPPVLPNQTITIKQGGTGDFKSYTTDSTYKGTDPGNNVPLTFTTGTLTGLNGVNCTNNSTTGVVTCTADATAPLTPDRTFTVTPKNSINITGSPATYTVKVVAQDLPPVLPNQTITIKQGGTGDFKSYTTDSTYKGTDPGNNVPLTFTTGTLTGLNGVNCTNNSTTGVVTCTADATAPLTPDRTFTVTPKNSINITGSPATYTVKVVAKDTPILTIDKISNPVTGSNVTPGQTITYTLNYRNTSTANATGVVITDVLDAKTTFTPNSCIPATITCTYDSATRTLTATIGALNANATGTFSFAVTVNSGATGTIENKATIKSSQSDPVISNIVTLIIGNPLTLTKSANVSSVTPGQTITYSLNYRNTGSTKLTEVKITDVIDSKTTFISNSCAFNPTATTYNCAYVDSNKTLTINIGELAAGATGTVTFQVAVNRDTSGNILNQATISSKETGSSNSNQVIIPITGGGTVIYPVNLNVTKTVSKNIVNQGDTVTYTINYSNTGSVQATNVVVTDVLDSNLTYVDASCTPTAQCVYNSSNKTLTYTVGTLNSGANGSFTFQAKVNSNATGTIPNTASIKSDQTPNPITSTVNITVQTTNNGLSIAKSANGTSFSSGDTITYTLTYSNNTGKEATNVVLTDVLDSKLTYVDASCSPNSQCTYDTSNKTITWKVGTLADKATGTASFQAKVNTDVTSGTIPNTGTIKSDQNPNPVSNTVTVSINGNIKAQLVISPKVIYVNRGPVDVRVVNIVDSNNKPLANATCKIDLVLPDNSTAQILTTSDATGTCVATIGQLGGVYSASGYPSAAGSGNVNKLTSLLGAIKGSATVTSGSQTTNTNTDQYTVISQGSQTVTNRTGGFEVFAAATSGFVAMLMYLYFTNFTQKEGANFTPKRSKEVK